MPEYRATDAGFHLSGPTGLMLAPDIFLNAAPDTAGTIRLDDGGRVWAGADPGGLVLAETRQDFPAEGPGAGPWTRTAEVVSVTFLRDGPGGPVPIGTLAPDAPLPIEVVYDVEGGFWQGCLAAVLADAIQAGGYVFRGGMGADVVVPATDILPMAAGARLYGRGGDDILSGGRADDVIRGGAGNDTIHDEGGAGRLRGGPGDDVITIGPWSSGSIARGGAGDDLLRSSNGADLLAGGRGADRLEGGRGDDRLLGGTGDDRLAAGEGNDRLLGGAGDDLLSGGDGSDIFVFRAGQAGYDTILDLDPAADRVLIRGLAGPGELTVSTEGADTILSWGAEGTQISLAGIHADPGDGWLDFG